MAVNIHEAKTHFSKIIERVAAGEDVVISRAGHPVAVVVSIEHYRPRRELGFAPGAFVMPSLEAFNAPLDEETLAAFSGN
ncbi:MAG: type II toxin-antitoxin system prevent-host-death family antitoxin [Bryobacteraceae bacterium]|nr:type II toxin-antitoxin system prevent-host-death family antitoxin [Bryobacteraceae bacterium]